MELRGFEPLTPSMRTRCATGLRYSPRTDAEDSKAVHRIGVRAWTAPTDDAASGSVVDRAAYESSIDLFVDHEVDVMFVFDEAI